MASVSFSNVNKIYDNKVHAVFDFNLEIEDKEFIVLVGPSGCGKSTTLRMLAGLEDITSGEIAIDGNIVNNIHPKDRDIAMVFQNYALYPHMTVYDNIAYGLKIRRFPKAEIDRRVQEAAKMLGLEQYLNRKPKALSGGQRQRVALGRAIVRNPKVFLMDEPLSNLDAKLRVSMRSKITKIHQSVGATTVYVTHDQTEAMTMADRIVVMKDGYIQQVGTPKEVYQHPHNMFVAGFIGSPAMNFLTGKYKDGKFLIAKMNEEGIIDGYGLEIALNKAQQELLKDYQDKELVLGIRPEDVYIEGQISQEHSEPLELKVDISELLGKEFVIYTDIEGQKFIITSNANTDVNGGDVIKFVFDMAKIHFFDIETTEHIG